MILFFNPRGGMIFWIQYPAKLMSMLAAYGKEERPALLQWKVKAAGLV